MRRYVVILIAFVYTILSIGINLHLHYCCGKLANIQLVSSDHNCCETDEYSHNGCGLDNHCCSNEDLKVSIDEKHQPSQFKVVFGSMLAVQICHFTSELPKITLAAQTISFGADSDPPEKLPLYLTQQSLLFYA